MSEEIINIIKNKFMKFEDLNTVAEEYNVGKGQGSGFLKLEQGDNRVRMVSEFEVLAKHWGNGKMLGICVGKEKGCAVCNLPEIQDDKGKMVPQNKPQVKFLMHVIDRKDGEFKIAELGWKIIDAINDLRNDVEYAFTDLPPYDINIKKTVTGTGKNPSDTSYTVVAARQNTALTAEEQEKVEKLTPISEVIQKMKEKASGNTEALDQYSEESKVEVVDLDKPPFEN